MLNQSYEALTICTLRRALVLILLSKADTVVKDEERKIKTINRSFDFPVVIRLKKFIHIPYKQVVLSRKNVLKRDSFKCGYCGRSDIPLTIDHIVPKAKGGKDTWDNLVTACTKCNNKKGDRTPQEAELKLLIKPTVPNHIFFIKNSVNKIDLRWKPYLFIDN